MDEEERIYRLLVKENTRSIVPAAYNGKRFMLRGEEANQKHNSSIGITKNLNEIEKAICPNNAKARKKLKQFRQRFAALISMF